MANIRVNCPTCKAELEIGDEYVGQEVECGKCLQPFKAEDPKSVKKPYKMQRSRDDEDDEDDDDRPRRKKRRRDDDEDDYDYSPPGASRGSSGGGTGLAVTSLILGIISFPMICCCYLNLPISVAGIVTGIIGMSKPNGRGMAIAGLVLSIVSLLLFGGFFVFGMAMNGMNFNNPGQFGR